MAGDGDEAIRGARAALRDLLSKMHVLEVLPERSRMLAVDAELPVHAVLTAVLGEQHPRAQPPRNSGAGLPGHGSSGGGAAGATDEAGAPKAAEDAVPLSWSSGSPSLPSNVLAEVCEDKPGMPKADDDAAGVQEDVKATLAATGDENIDEKLATVRRGWTSPDDGWGMNVPGQDLEKMPMGMPITVGELADFLAHACQSTPGQASPPPTQDGTPTSADMLDWSLSQWRAHRLKMSRDKGEVPAADEAEEPATPVVVLEELPSDAGPVLVHKVPLAPPRPILCLDDPDATLLKAVELLLSYPELDALPIVNPTRCTLMGHLTLSYCLAYMLMRMRGPEFFPFANLMVGGDSDGGAQRVFEAALSPTPAPSGSEAWGDRRSASVPQLPWVLRPAQPLRELLTFFAKTHYSGVPVIEDGGGIRGLLSRRDILHYLDLTMQMARRRSDNSTGEDSASFDVGAPIEAMLETLRRFRTHLPADDGASGAAPPAASASQSQSGDKEKHSLHGATFIYEKELSLKHLILRVLAAENRKVLFVKDAGSGAAPQLLRILSVSDVWQLLLGASQDAPRLGAGGKADMVAQEL